MELRLSGKVAIVTGAGQGIGKAVALRLAGEGAGIVAVDINHETAVATARELQALGGPASAHSMDVACLSEIACLVEDIVGVFGRIDILVNALGDEFHVSVAIDGNQALRIISETEPDIILLDIVMPLVDGYEVCRRIKGKEETKNIPVIFLTALNDEDAEEKGLNLRAVDFISYL